MSQPTENLTDVQVLQARLIKRTEEATATAYRDAETIHRLRSALITARNQVNNGVASPYIIDAINAALKGEKEGA